jgi:hypothetical protein
LTTQSSDQLFIYIFALAIFSNFTFLSPAIPVRTAIVEGISLWMVLALMAAYGLAGLSILLAVVSVGFLIARRRYQALKLFAGAVLCLASGGAFFPLAFTGETDAWWILMYAFAAGLAPIPSNEA